MPTMRDTFAFTDLLILALTFCSPARRLHILFGVPGASHGWTGRGGQACKDARTKDWCQLRCISWPLLDCVLAFYLAKKAPLWDYVDLYPNRAWWFWCGDITGLLMKCTCFCWLKLDLVLIFFCEWKGANHLSANDCMFYLAWILYEEDILKVI